jgi:hypothetical protein
MEVREPRVGVFIKEKSSKDKDDLIFAVLPLVKRSSTIRVPANVPCMI